MFECTKSGGLTVRDYWEYIADKKEIEDVSMMYRITMLIFDAIGLH